MPTHYALKDRTIYADDSGAVVTIDQAGTGPNLELKHDTSPEVRFKEEDQTAPAGLFRIRVNGDVLIFERAAASDWSSDTDILTITATGGINIGSIALDDDEAITFGGVVSVLYETADANANELVIALPNGGATDVPVIVIGDQSVLNANLGNHNGIVEPTVAIYNAAANAYIAIDAGDINGATAGVGIYFKAAADEDINILKLSVTGTPSMVWDESDNRFSFNVGIDIDGVIGIDLTPGSDTDTDIITVNVTGTPRIYWDESDDVFRATKAFIGGNMTPTSGTTTANWNTATGTSGESGEDLVTIGANDTEYILDSLVLDVSACTNGAVLTVKLFQQVNGTERKVYSEGFVVNTDPDGLWIVAGRVGIHEALRVEVYSDTSESVAIAYDYILEAM